MLIARAGKWRDSADLRHAHPQLLGRARGLLLGAAIPAAAPVHEHAATAQQRRRVLHHDRLRPDCPADHHVACAFPRAPLLCPLAHDPHVLEAELGDRALQIEALPRLALHQVHDASGQRHRERQAGETRT